MLLRCLCCRKALSPVELYALLQRQQFSSYLDYEADANRRQFFWTASPTVRWSVEERSLEMESEVMRMVKVDQDGFCWQQDGSTLDTEEVVAV